jgi:nucleotide-binding universal stress UspA family protein
MRVLLATDGSNDAQEACQWLTYLPLPAGTMVRVVTVATIPPSPLDIPPVRDYQASLRHAARAVADGACAVLAHRFRTIEAQVLEGDPREEIVRAAEEWPADLVVLGARGLGPVAGFLLGSVSVAVSRHVHCPVLVTKGKAREVRRALVAVDGSDQAAAAAAFVGRIAMHRASVTLLAVVERPRALSAVPPMTDASLPAVIEQIVAERTTALRAALRRARTAVGDGMSSVEQRVTNGYPAAEILRAADDDESDLIIVGARGLGPVKRLLLGSVSEAVLRHADRPVLIVRGGTS